MGEIQTPFCHKSRLRDEPFGAMFRVAGLSAGQVLLKVFAPNASDAWLLLLGGGMTGRYPSPWYGAMEDIRDKDIFVCRLPLAIAATGPRVFYAGGRTIFPGFLIARPNGGRGAFIEGSTAIDVRTGRPFRVDLPTAVAYGRWVMDVGEATEQQTVLFYSSPELGA